MSMPTPSIASSSTSIRRAQEILGKNFLDIEHVRQHFFDYTKKQLQQLAEIPFSKETLQACKDTHVLVAGAPLSLNEIRKLAASNFRDNHWYKRQAFTNDKKVSARWYLLRKEPMPKSCGMTYNQQTALLAKEEEVPFACEVVYTVILYWLTYRERLLPKVYVRCQDKDSDGNRVHVGYFDSEGFDVYSFWDDLRHDNLGLASSVPPRKS